MNNELFSRAAVGCIASLGVAGFGLLADESVWREFRGSYPNLLERLRCYWAFARLTVLLNLVRDRRKFLCQCLLLLVSVLQFLYFCEDVFRKFLSGS